MCLIQLLATSPDSTVSILTGPWVQPPGGLNPGGRRGESSPLLQKFHALGPNQLLIQRYQGSWPGWCSDQRVKFTTHILLSSEVQKKWSYSFIPLRIRSWRLQGQIELLNYLCISRGVFFFSISNLAKEWCEGNSAYAYLFNGRTGTGFVWALGVPCWRCRRRL